MSAPAIVASRHSRAVGRRRAAKTRPRIEQCAGHEEASARHEEWRDGHRPRSGSRDTSIPRRCTPRRTPRDARSGVCLGQSPSISRRSSSTSYGTRDQRSAPGIDAGNRMSPSGDGADRTKRAVSQPVVPRSACGDRHSIASEEPRVAHDRVERRLIRETQRELAAAGVDHRVPARREEPLDEQQIRRAGIDDEHVERPRCLAGVGAGRLVSTAIGRRITKRAPDSGACLERNRSAMIGDDSVDHGQAEARAFAFILRRPERIPDLRVRCGRESRDRRPRLR